MFVSLVFRKNIYLCPNLLNAILGKFDLFLIYFIQQYIINSLERELKKVGN